MRGTKDEHLHIGAYIYISVCGKVTPTNRTSSMLVRFYTVVQLTKIFPSQFQYPFLCNPKFPPFKFYNSLNIFVYLLLSIFRLT